MGRCAERRLLEELLNEIDVGHDHATAAVSLQP
jgi:hypothetical protein